MVWGTTKKRHVLDSLASFPVATVISGDSPSPRTVVYYISMFATTNFSILSFLSLPGIEPAKYFSLVVGQTIGQLSHVF